MTNRLAARLEWQEGCDSARRKPGVYLRFPPFSGINKIAEGSTAYNRHPYAVHRKAFTGRGGGDSIIAIEN